MTTQEAIHKALKVLNCLNNGRVYETAWVKGAINACEEALEQPAQELNDEYSRDFYVGGLNQPMSELDAYIRSALDNARDVCKYLDHNMVEKAKINTQFFWDDLDKIRELSND